MAYEYKWIKGREIVKMGKWLLLLLIVVVGGVAAYQYGWFGGDRDAPSAATQPATGGAGTPASSPSSSSSDQPSAGASAKPADDVQASASADGQDSPDDPAALPAWAVDNLPGDTIETKGEIAVVTNPASVHVLVNKKRNLPSDYIPEDLVVPDVPFSFSGDSPKKQMRKEAAAALEDLVAAAKQDGVTLKAVSGYRSYKTQQSLFDSYAKKDGIEAANRYSAHPGQSEHQTGLTMDISGASVNYQLTADLGKAKEGIWLAEHAAEYGFIIRYPEGKEDITGYTYEPWHIRYIGADAAEAVYESKLTFEQYFETLEVGAKR